LILLAGLWLGLELSERQSRHFDLNGGKLYNLALVSLAAALIGGRLVFAAQNPQFFSANPFNLLSLSPSLLSVPGGLVAGAIAGLAFGQRSRFPIMRTLDALTSCLAVLMIAIALANFASGDAYGRLASLPWSVELAGALRHPSQVYEALAAGCILIVLWPFHQNPLHTWCMGRPGARFWIFIAMTAFARLCLEIFRGDSQAVFNNLRLAQLVAWGLLALSLWQINRLFPRPGQPTGDVAANPND
jgi:phosphatidylglycerol:prolipoprotein diacylglycerol transferase